MPSALVEVMFPQGMSGFCKSPLTHFCCTEKQLLCMAVSGRFMEMVLLSVRSTQLQMLASVVSLKSFVRLSRVPSALKEGAGWLLMHERQRPLRSPFAIIEHWPHALQGEDEVSEQEK